MKEIPFVQPIIPDLNIYTEYLKEIFESGQFTNNGPAVKLLEKELSTLMNVNHSSAFCNGTTALMIALKALEIKGPIITTPFTFPATVNSILWNNSTPIFCDIDYETMNITPESVEECISNSIFSVQAVLPVHTFGIPCDVYGFQKLSFDYRLKVIYDAAHAFNTQVDDIHIGNFGDISMLSFHPTKLFHTGEGGLLTYSDNKLDTPIKQLRNFGIKDDDTGSVLPGINGKMNELQASIGLCVLEKISDEIKKRKKVFDLYKSFLSGISWIKFLKIEKNVQISYQYFPIRILFYKNFRNKIYEQLKKNGVHARKYFYPLCSNFEYLSHIKTKLPNAVKVSEEILCLPFYGDLTEDDIERICEIIIMEGDNHV